MVGKGVWKGKVGQGNGTEERYSPLPVSEREEDHDCLNTRGEKTEVRSMHFLSFLQYRKLVFPFLLICHP